MSEDRGHYRSLSVAASNVAATAAIVATHQELRSPRAMHRIPGRSVDEISESVRSPVEAPDDEEYDEEILARLADSVQSEGGRSGKHVSWNTVSQERRSGSLGPTSQRMLSSRPSFQMTDPRDGEPDVRGRPQQRVTNTEDDWRRSGEHATHTLSRTSRSRAGRRSASLVFLGLWTLFGVGTFVGNRRGLPLTSSTSIGRVLASVDNQPPQALDPSELIKPNHEPEGFSWVEILVDTSGTDNGKLPPPRENPSIERIVGRMAAWTCTILYLTSRLPQIWKNVSMMIYAISLALMCCPSSLGSLSKGSPCTFSSSHSLETLSMFHRSSRLRSWTLPGLRPRHISERVFREFLVFHNPMQPRISHILSYLLGSAGTLMFDVTIVSQFFLYQKLTDKGKMGRRNSRVGRGMSPEEEGLLSAGATGADEGASPQHRRRTMGDPDDNV